MKKHYYIAHFIQRTEEDRPFFYYPDGSWGTNRGLAMSFIFEEEVIAKVRQLIQKENGEYQIIETYF